MAAAPRSRALARSSARLSAVQAIYQREMEPATTPALLHQYHQHWLGAELEGERLREADVPFFDDLVAGVDARAAEIDALISAHVATGWTLDRLDRPMRAVLRAAVYELVARPDVPIGTVINEYLDVAHAFFDRRETGFVNALLDAVARRVRVA